MITTECMVTDLPKDDKADLGAAGMERYGRHGRNDVIPPLQRKCDRFSL